MIILTCANVDICPNEFGRWYEGFSFKDVITKTVENSKKCGYIPVVYDLGSLGMGEPFVVNDNSFQKNGYYEHQVMDGYKSRSLFKPEVVKKCINEHEDIVVYLDGDAQLVENIDEIATKDYDIGVTLRDKSEFESKWYREHIKIVKYVNAGVIFFNPTDATKNFVREWEILTNKVGNDQKALNELVCPDNFPEENSIVERGGVRVKYFPGIKYNYYYFNECLPGGIKIMHFKGNVRNYFPFDWRKQAYCKLMRPVINFIKKPLRKTKSIRLQ